MKNIFKFWLSLASTTFFMALEVPICTAAISRLEESELNLAAFGIVASCALFIQSPVLRLMSTPLMFVQDIQSYRILRNFSLCFSIIVSLVFLILSLDPIYSLFVVPFLGLKHEITDLVQSGLLMWSGFPILIGMRRFYQGVILCGHEPKKIALATFLRLLTLISYTWFSPLKGYNTGVALGVFGIGSGMFVEMIVSAIFAQKQISKYSQSNTDNIKSLSVGNILKKFIPLSVSSSVSLSNSTILSVFVARGFLAIESLALMPIIFGLLNPFTWAAFATQDTTHALLTKSKESYNQVKSFSIRLGIILSIILFLIGASVLSDYYFLYLNHLQDNLYRLTAGPVLLISLIPFTMATKNFYRGVLIADGRSKMLLISESFEIISLIIVMGTLSMVSNLPAINLAMISMWISGLMNLVFLYYTTKK